MNEARHEWSRKGNMSKKMDRIHQKAAKLLKPPKNKQTNKKKPRNPTDATKHQ